MMRSYELVTSVKLVVIVKGSGLFQCLDMYKVIFLIYLGLEGVVLMSVTAIADGLVLRSVNGSDRDRLGFSKVERFILM